MAHLMNIRKFTDTNESRVSQSPSLRSIGLSASSSLRSLEGELLDVVDPFYWELNRMDADFEGFELVDDVEDEFSEELALSSPPQECWYHGKLNRTEAELRLSEIQTPGAYLVRQSINSPDTYCISFISSQGIIHFRIMVHTGSYFIGGRRFTCLSDIVAYYISYSTVVASETLKIPVPPKGAVCTQIRIMAIDNYTQSLETEELSFRRGDILVVLSEINEAWYWAKSSRTGETGMVPRDLFMDVTKLVDVCTGKPWFHDNISRDKSQALVAQETRVGTFLVRPSETPDVYVLIVRGISGPLKFKIYKEDYYFLGKRPYTSIDEIIKHYKKEPIHEQICLGFPIPKTDTPLPIELPVLAPEEIEKKHKSFKEKAHHAKMKEKESILKSGAISRKERVSFRTKWKSYHIQLHKDHKLVFKESEKHTKAKHLIDLSNCSINHIHSSLFIKDHVFLIIDYALMQKRTVNYLAFQTKEDYDIWFDALKKFTSGEMSKENKEYQTIRNLTIGVQACNFGTSANLGLSYCVLSMNNCEFARTNIAQYNNKYCWNKEFTFCNLSHDLTNIKIKVYTKSPLLKSNAGASMGETTISFSSLPTQDRTDAWYALNSKSGPKGSLRLKARFQNEIVLLLREYELFQAALLEKSLVAIQSLENLMSDDRSTLSASLVQILRCSQTSHILIPTFLDYEVNKALNESKSSLFRNTTLATSIMDHLMRSVCINYIQEILSEQINSIINEQHSLEIDPLKISELQIQDNLSVLLYHIQSVWDRIHSSANKLPRILRYIFFKLRGQVSEKWPDDKLVGHKIVSCFLFLRFICPAITNPKLYFIVEDPPPNSTRSLTLVAKALQNLSNFATLPKEQYMRVLKYFLEEKQKEMKSFLDVISSQDAIPSYQEVEIDAANDLATIHHKVQAVRGKLNEELSPQVVALVKASDLLLMREDDICTAI